MQYHYLYLVLPMIFLISVLIISIIIGGGSWGAEIITIQKTNDNRRNHTTSITIDIDAVEEQLNPLDKVPLVAYDVYTNETLTFSRDEHEHCSFWASIGECKKNPNFMLKGCRRSCDLSVTISNEAPCMKTQREWFHDFRDEYLDHSTPDNVLRNEALFKIQFFTKIRDVIGEYGEGKEDDKLIEECMFDLLNDNEQLNINNDLDEVKEKLLAIGGEDYANYYNLLLYYLNIVEGTDYDYVSSTSGLINKTSIEAITRRHHAIDSIIDYDEGLEEERLEKHTSSNGISIGTITRRQAIDNITEYEGSFLQAEIKSAGLKGTGTQEEEEEYLHLDGFTDEFDTKEIQQWLNDTRDYFIGWRNALERDKEYDAWGEAVFFQMYFVGKVIDLLVPEVVPEVGDEGIHAASYNKASFPKIDDIEKRDKVSAYMLSLLDGDERFNLLDGLDRLEDLMSKVGKPYAFDFDNLMGFFLDCELVARETIEEDNEKLQPTNWPEIESALTTKPNPELKDSWTWEDMSDVMLLGICDQVGYSNGLEWTVNRAHLYNSLLQAAKECHVIQALLGVLPDQNDDWMVIMNRRDALEYMISHVHVTDDEKSDLRVYFDEKLDSEVTGEMPKEDNSQVVEDESGMLQNLLDKVKSLKLNENVEETIVAVLLCFASIAFLCFLPIVLLIIAEFEDELDNCLIFIFGFIGRVVRMPYELYWEKRIQTTLYVRSSMSKKLAGKQGLDSSSKNLSGKQGRKKNRFMNKSGVDDIQIDTSDDSSDVAVRLTGSRQSITKAVAMIQEAVGIDNISWKRINLPSHSNPIQEESSLSTLIDGNDTTIDDQSKHHRTNVDDDNMSRKTSHSESGLSCVNLAEQDKRGLWYLPSLLLVLYDSARSKAIVSLGFIQHLFTSICSILRRGIKCLVLIPQMISTGIGMLIRLPSKLIRDTIGTEHVSIDRPSKSSPQQVEAPQLAMSPQSAISSGNTSVDKQKDGSMKQKTSPIIPMRKEEIPSEIGFDSSQVLTCGTITEASMSDLNGISNTKANSEFSLNDNDPLLIFLRSQHQCIRGNVDEFYIWLVKSEYIDSMSALKEAVCDDVYYNDTMKVGSGRSGIKVFKRREFQRAVLEFEVLDDDQSLSQYESKASSNNLNKPPASHNDPPEELVCPISLVLMTNDPVVAADGITYERASIEDWFEKSKAKISEAQEKKHNPHSEADQRVVTNGICSPVYGSKLDNLALVPNTVVRNMARAYKEGGKKKEVH